MKKRDIVPELLIGNSLLQSDDDRQKIASGLEAIPISRMMDQCQYLQNTVLPELEKKSGKDSNNYKYWLSVHSSLLWAIVICDRYEATLLRLSRVETLCAFYREMEEKANKELTKYQTIEEMVFTDGLEKHVQAVSRRVTDLLNDKKVKE